MMKLYSANDENCFMKGNETNAIVPFIKRVPTSGCLSSAESVKSTKFCLFNRTKRFC